MKNWISKDSITKSKESSNIILPPKIKDPLCLNCLYLHYFFAFVITRVNNNCCNASIICPIEIFVHKLILCITEKPCRKRKNIFKFMTYCSNIVSVLIIEPLLFLIFIFSIMIGTDFWNRIEALITIIPKLFIIYLQSHPTY